MKIEDIKNIHYNHINEIEFEYGGQVHHHSMESLKEVFINYWTVLNNWNELKEWLEDESKLKGTETAYLYYGRVLSKMQEIEGGVDND